MPAEKLNIRGTILGVPVDFTIWPQPDTADPMKISGEAAGKPLQLDVVFDQKNDRLSVTGELLGHSVNIEGYPVE